MTAPVMRTVGFVASQLTGNNTTFNVALPTHATGEKLYIVIVSDAASQTFNVPADWDKTIPDTSIYPTNNASSLVMISKTAGASETNPITITTTVSERAVWIAFAVQGDGGLDGTVQANAGNTTTTAQVPSIVTSVADTLVVSIVGTDSVTTPHGTPSGYNRLTEISYSSAGSISVNYQTVATASTIAAENSSLGVQDQWRGWTFAIKGVGGTNYNQSVSGTVTSSGAIQKSSQKNLVGAVTSAGTLLKQTLHLLSGAINSSGQLAQTLTSILSGAVSSSGVLVTQLHHNYLQVISGEVTPSGGLLKSISKSLSGVVTSAGTLLKTSLKSLSGTVSSLGSLSRSFSVTPTRQKPPSAIYQQNNLSFLITAPAWGGSTYSNDVTQMVQSYEHSSTAVGGFYSATLSLKLPLTELEDWIENGIGRQVQVKGRANTLAWEGLINRISVNVGGYNLTVGPYTDICNRVKITYSIFLQLGGGNATGIRVVSGYLNDTKSQERYGILEKNFSSGGIDTDSVTQLQQMLLNRYAYPSRSEDLTLPGDILRPLFDVKIECIGYVSLFEKYTYNSSTEGTQNLSTKLSSIIAAEPNGLFSSTVTVNTLQVPAYENDDAEAWGLIKELLLQGDVTFNRYKFGVYENRRVIYEPSSNEIVYVRPFREGISVIQNSSGGILQPWEIRPGNYIWVSDLVPGRPLSSNLEDDRRIIYADTVQYRMPDGLVINGAHHFKVEQRLAQLGISGLG